MTGSDDGLTMADDGDEPPLSALILASGDNARMRSLRPKPLHVLCGRPILFYVLDALSECHVRRVAVVLNSGSERVTKRIHEYEAPATGRRVDPPRIDSVEQPVARGTGDAVSVGLTAFSFDDLDEDEDLLVMAGDMPLLRPATLARLVTRHRIRGAACTVLTTPAEDGDAGHIVRGRDDRIMSATGQLDALSSVDDDAADAPADETTALVFCIRKNLLAPALRRLEPMGEEYYLADVVAVLAEAGHRVESMVLDDRTEVMTVDDRPKMADVEAELRRRTNLAWQEEGVTLVDPAATYIDTTVVLGTDVTIFPNTMLQGRTVVGEGAELGPDTRLTDCMIGGGARVEKTVGRDAEVGPDAVVGPFAVLETGAQVAPGERVAPFSVATSTDPATQS